MIDGSGTINPAALNTPGKFPSSQSTSLGDRLPFPWRQPQRPSTFVCPDVTQLHFGMYELTPPSLLQCPYYPLHLQSTRP